MSVAANLVSLRERIGAAARQAGRHADEIALMAVTKTVPPARIREAYAAGLRLFGENRVQEFGAKSAELKDLSAAQWHLIGHLQTNKAAHAAGLFSAIDSLDSLRLAEKLEAAAQKLNQRIPVLIEINLAAEQSKSGFAPDSPDLEQLLVAAPRFSHLEIRGLMAIPPFAGNPESSRPYFRRLRRLRDQLQRRNLPAIKMDVLSMGMSHDFEIAIAEGSTCVRIGTAIFGPRPRP